MLQACDVIYIQTVGLPKTTVSAATLLFSGAMIELSSFLKIAAIYIVICNISLLQATFIQVCSKRKLKV